jgi:hypothetical protein
LRISAWIEQPTAMSLDADGGSLEVREGRGGVKPLTDSDRQDIEVPVVQSEWGITPYKGLMGALKVRDELEVVLDVRLPAG